MVVEHIVSPLIYNWQSLDDQFVQSSTHSTKVCDDTGYFRKKKVKLILKGVKHLTHYSEFRSKKLVKYLVVPLKGQKKIKKAKGKRHVFVFKCVCYICDVNA